MTVTVPTEVQLYLRAFGGLAALAVSGEPARALIEAARQAVR
jgi:hypothetical protein